MLVEVTTQDDIWSEAAITRFEELTLEQKLKVFVHGPPGASGHVPVTLAVPGPDGEATFVHKQLIVEGLAI